MTSIVYFGEKLVFTFMTSIVYFGEKLVFTFIEVTEYLFANF
jgi:hypothetical protein